MFESAKVNAAATASRSKVGAVVIGRNEGERLRRCLESVRAEVSAIVYVDSGSKDDSVVMARALDCAVVELDMATPFTAARARNAGFERLRRLAPHLPYVQFVDGDCEVVESWLGKAMAFLDDHRDVVAVCGRRRERYPEQSIYNMLCDYEWNTPVGEAKEFGGDVLIRADVFAMIDGYRADLIAGEEPELCIRLRAAGCRIWRLDAEMTLHDAAIYTFGQWWRRAKRAGYAFAEGAALHGASAERHGVRESRSIWFWGLALPTIGVASALLVGPVSLLLFTLYPLQIVRLSFRGSGGLREKYWRGLFLILGKFPEVLGQLKFLADRAFGLRARIIEYK